MPATKPTPAQQVQDFLTALDHPHKAEVEAVYAYILSLDPRLQPRVKWNSPSIHYGKFDLSAFHLRDETCAHLILVWPPDSDLPPPAGLLEGAHKDRRQARFYSMPDVEAKKEELKAVVQDWLARAQARL